MSNFCKQCGKEIPEGRKFCNSSCAAKYNNKHRTRKPWTEEQKKRISLKMKLNFDAKRQRKKYNSDGTLKLKHCIYCGKVSGTHRVCEECSSYSKPSIYRKLHLTEGSLRSRFETAKDLVRGWYFRDKQSIPEIREHTGLHFGTIRYLLTVDGEATRNKSESNKNAIEQGRLLHHPCSPCYKSGKHKTWEGQVYTFRSSWEEKYMQELDEKKISYLYEPFSIRYFDTVQKKERIAIPDFFFPETNTILELKSSWTYDEQNMQDRFKSYREKGYKAKLLLDWQEVSL